MARNKKQDDTLLKSVNTVRETVANVNRQVLTTTDELVNNALKNSAAWQKLFAKALKNGTKLYSGQQDFVLSTLENLKKQGGKDLTRLQNLVGIDTDAARKVVADVTARARQEAAKVDDLVDDIKEKATETAMKAMTEVNKVAKQVTQVTKSTKKTATKKAAKVAKAATDTSTKATQATAKKTKTVAKAATPKKASPKAATKRTTKKATTKNTTAPQDLKVIEGVGPKLESILKEAGITTYKTLATTPVANLKAIILKAGPRYKSYDPSSWAEQALLADAGKMDALNALQNQLKGGEIK